MPSDNDNLKHHTNTITMKTNTLLLTIASLLTTMFTACDQKPSDTYVLRGTIQGLPDGTHIQLVPVSHEHSKPIADTTVVGGQFTFTGNADEPLAVLLMVKDAYGSRRLMLENASIDVSGSVTADSVNGMPNYDLEKLTVTGSPLSARYDSLMSVHQSMDSLYQANARNYKDVPREVREKVDAAFFHTVDSVYHATIMREKDSFWGPLLLVSLTSYLTDDQKPWYEAFSDEAKASRYGLMVKDELYPAGMVGSKVPEFTVKGTDGQDVTLASLREGKKYVLIDFWASWCGPCRKEIPNLKALYKQYADRGFDIVSISIDKKKTDWEKALEEEQLPWNNYLDETGVASLYHVKAIPAMYLIDAEGVMVGENLRGEALADKLAELLR